MLGLIGFVSFVFSCIVGFIAATEAWKYLYPIIREKKASKFRLVYCVGFFAAFCSLVCRELLRLAAELFGFVSERISNFIATREIWQSSKQMKFLKEGFSEGNRVWNVDIVPNPDTPGYDFRRG